MINARNEVNSVKTQQSVIPNSAPPVALRSNALRYDEIRNDEEERHEFYLPRDTDNDDDNNKIAGQSPAEDHDNSDDNEDDNEDGEYNEDDEEGSSSGDGMDDLDPAEKEAIELLNWLLRDDHGSIMHSTPTADLSSKIAEFKATMDKTVANTKSPLISSSSTSSINSSTFSSSISKKNQSFSSNSAPRPLFEAQESIPGPVWPSGRRSIDTPPSLDPVIAEKDPEYFRIKSGARSLAMTSPPPASSSKVNFDPVCVYEEVFRLKKDGKLRAYYEPISQDDTTLVFESRFESGNLERAIRINEFEYNLVLRTDLNTLGHTQWYYFKVSNTRADVPYKFNITNLMKPASLYNVGMQPLLYSEKEKELKERGWHRQGRDIAYFRNATDFTNLSPTAVKTTYTLTFTISFKHDRDTCYIAHCYPYTYSDLQKYIFALKENPQRNQYFKHRVICASLGGNNVDLLTVTTKVNSPQDLEKRRGIVITSRVHPGETPSSWMMKGFIDFITGESEEAKFLRDRFIIKIVPMLNPDGVIIGNYRCNLAGYDLNRTWHNSSNKAFAPEIYHVREMIAQFSASRELAMYCDFHGHNRKHGIFLYGCNNDNDEAKKFQERVFPYMLSQNAENLFYFKRCQFKVQKSKEGTSRIALWKKFDIVNCFTLEASFCGSDLSPTGGFHYTVKDLEKMGQSLAKTLYEYFGEEDVVRQVHTHIRDVLSKPQEEHAEDSDDEDLEPDESDESDTSSDDEELRIEVPASLPSLEKGEKKKSKKKVKKTVASGDKKSKKVSKSLSKATSTNSIQKKMTLNVTPSPSYNRSESGISLRRTRSNTPAAPTPSFEPPPSTYGVQAELLDDILEGPFKHSNMPAPSSRKKFNQPGNVIDALRISAKPISNAEVAELLKISGHQNGRPESHLKMSRSNSMSSSSTDSLTSKRQIPGTSPPNFMPRTAGIDARPKESLRHRTLASYLQKKLEREGL